jgi:signal transduction histidine kinase
MRDQVPRLSGRLLGSVRMRVTASATIAVVVVLVLAGLALLEAQHQQLVDHVDESVERRADELTRALRGVPAATALSARGPDTVAQLVREGRIVAASPALEGRPVLAHPRATKGLRTVHDVPLDEGDYRVLIRDIAVRRRPGTLLVGGSLDDVSESTEAVRGSLLVGIPLVAALFALLVWALVGRLLRKVDAAARAQQQFVADASHELRTPLARMRAELEVDLAHPETADALATRRSLLDETVALQRLTDDLLLLARSDAGDHSHRDDILDLDAVVAAECAGAPVPVGTSLAVRVTPATRVRGDAGQLARAVRNVLDNGLRHADRRVTVTLDVAGGHAQLEVRDDGPGVPVTDRSRVFERFARTDEARGTGDGGSGLGLAITRDIVERHGGSVAALDGEHGGACFQIVLPLVR